MSRDNSTKTSIMKAMRDIRDGDLVLPGIQRDFVWDPQRIYALLDSIMRGYPFGALLFWNTKQRVQFRRFAEGWTDDFRPTFEVKPEGQPATLVLDGQQRLQSLYLALMGSHERRLLYFDLLSGEDVEDISEAKYHFEFLLPSEAEHRNADQLGKQLWVPLRQVTAGERRHLVAKARQYQQAAGVAPDSAPGERLEENLTDAYHKLNSDELLNFFTIDPEYGDGEQVTGLDEVLEIFVRVNSGGEVLAKSDLMFSLMQLQWEGAADAIADLCAELNSRGRFDFNKDFVLKCALVCTGQGARYEVDKLRKDEVLQAIQAAFPCLRDALIATVDFAVNTSRFHDGRVLGSYNTLIPFVYYLYLQGGKAPREEGTRLAMNQALYLALMTRALSHYADYRIDRLVTTILNPMHERKPGQFPLAELRTFVRDVEGVTHLDDALLQRNVPLLVNIIEGGSQLPEGQRRYRPEYDHIFPRSRLGDHGYTNEQINDYANLRLISKSENNWKSDTDPAPYFGAEPQVRVRHLVPAEYLDYAEYPRFLEARRALIWQRVHDFLGMGPGEALSDGSGLATEDESRSIITPKQVPSSSGSDGGGHARRSLEAVCRLADQNGIGVPFRRILEVAKELKLKTRPHKRVVVYAPRRDGRLFLFNIEALPDNQGRLKGWISPPAFSKYLGLPEEEVAQLLGPRGVLTLGPDEIDPFLDKLGSLVRRSDSLA